MIIYTSVKTLKKFSQRENTVNYALNHLIELHWKIVFSISILIFYGPDK